MTLPQSAAEADVKIRTPRRDWMVLFAAGVIALAGAVFSIAFDLDGSTLPLVIGCVFIAEALWIRTFGVDLTRESANLRGLRRRSIPWQQVQAVLRDDLFGAQRVTLILENGEVGEAASSDDLLGAGCCRVRARLPPHRAVVAGASWRVLAPCAPRDAGVGQPRMFVAPAKRTVEDLLADVDA